MADRIYVECEKCDGVSTVKHDQDHHFYQVKYCPFCGEELQREEEFKMSDPFEEEYEAGLE
tara:strand:+ start:425 stop:607 length:183 start_codon:yes stop_codon:yes gene_type:complete